MIGRCLRGSSDFLKWGCITYLSIVSVLPTVEGGWHNQFGEADSCTSTDTNQCTAVNGVSSEMYFNLKKPRKNKKIYISLRIHFIKNILSALPCRQIALSFGTTFSQPVERPYSYA